MGMQSPWQKDTRYWLWKIFNSVTGGLIIGATTDAGPSWTPVKFGVDGSGAGGGLQLFDPTTAPIIDDLVVSVDADVVIEITNGVQSYKVYLSARVPLPITFRDGLIFTTGAPVVIKAAAHVYAFGNYHE